MLAGPADGLVVDVTDLPPELTQQQPELVSAVADDGIDDRPAIQAAIEWITGKIQNSEIERGTVYLPAGTFHVSQSIQVNVGLHIVGAGMDATTVTSTESLAFDGRDITDKQVQLSKVNRAGYLIDLDRESDGASLSDLTLRGPNMLAECSRTMRTAWRSTIRGFNHSSGADFARSTSTR